MSDLRKNKEIKEYIEKQKDLEKKIYRKDYISLKFKNINNKKSQDIIKKILKDTKTLKYNPDDNNTVVFETKKRKKKRIKIKKSKEKVKKSFKEINESISKLKNTDKYKEFLDYCSKNYNYSTNNKVLIRSQNPNASVCKGYNQWKKLGRHVKKGEKSIKILAPFTKTYRTKKLDDEGNPVKKDGKYVYEKQKYTYYGFVSVFDVSQTEGKPLPTLMDKVKGNKEFAKLLMDNLDKIGKEINYDIKLEPYKGSSGGYHNRSEKKIRINSNNKTTPIEQATTLIHELSHAFAHGTKEADNYTTQRKELEAESINYVVSKRFGIDTKNRSVGYITSWANNDNERNEKFKKLLDSVTKHSGKLINTIEKTLSKELKLLKNNKKNHQEKSKNIKNVKKTKKEQLSI